MSVAKVVARQLRRPAGPIGAVMGFVLDRGNRTINQQAVDRLAVDGAQRVLEVGFGGGGTLARILARPDARVAGVEISDAMLSRAASKSSTTWFGRPASTR